MSGEEASGEVASAMVPCRHGLAWAWLGLAWRARASRAEARVSKHGHAHGSSLGIEGTYGNRGGQNNC